MLQLPMPTTGSQWSWMQTGMPRGAANDIQRRTGQTRLTRQTHRAGPRHQSAWPTRRTRQMSPNRQHRISLQPDLSSVSVLCIGSDNHVPEHKPLHDLNNRQILRLQRTGNLQSAQDDGFPRRGFGKPCFDVIHVVTSSSQCRSQQRRPARRRKHRRNRQQSSLPRSCGIPGANRGPVGLPEE